ncbi:MAG: glycosyltransferase family 1 protein [Patescibacteria group bacterium]
MLIGIDGNEANIERRVGVNVYAYELLRNIYELQGEWEARHRLVVYLNHPPLEDLPKENDRFKYKVIPGKGLWIIKNLMPSLFLARDRPDVFFTPSHYVPPLAPMPRVCSIMDLGYLEFPAQFKKYDYWQLKYWSAWSISVSKKIIAISESTKRDILKQYPLARDKVVITYLGYDREHFNARVSISQVKDSNKYSIGLPYILFLSTLKPSKNIENLLVAWKLISNRFPRTLLVISGKKGWLYEAIFRMTKSLGIEKRVVFTDFVPEEDKPALISGAKLFVLPSYWEGFGLDVLNAMACGVPVVVSDRGSLPEVAGNAGIVVDPKDPQSIARGIAKVLSMPGAEYNNLVKKGFSQVSRFSWEDTARKTIKILEEI